MPEVVEVRTSYHHPRKAALGLLAPGSHAELTCSDMHGTPGLLESLRSVRDMGTRA